MRIDMTYQTITLPTSLYSMFGTLQTLILEKLSLVDVASSTQVHLRFLKTLQLLYVKFSDDESVQRLLSSCPVLENLVVRRTSYVRVAMFSIKVPTLKCLSIDCASIVYKPKGDNGFVIETPSLEYFNIRDNFSNVLKFGHMPQLVKANVDIACDQLNSLLENASRLQVLSLKLNHRVGYWNPPSFVPQCLLSHLEMCEWRHYNGTNGEKKVVKYILANAKCIKKATFSSISPQLYQIFNKLEYVPKQPTCQLVFK